MDAAFDLVVARSAARAIAEVLPEAAAAAAVEFLAGPLVQEPHRVGRELRYELAGIRSARRGTFRILYRIDENRRQVVVLRIDHRRDVYRS